LSEEKFQEYINKRNDIQSKTKVYIRSTNTQIAYVGKLENINRAKQELKDLFESTVSTKIGIKIDEDDYKWYFAYKQQLTDMATGSRC
jgi:rRNA processing protein Krr1/Pno1